MYQSYNSVQELIQKEYGGSTEKFIEEIRSHLPFFSNDLHGFQKHIKKLYGFWLDAWFREDGSVSLSIHWDKIQIVHRLSLSDNVANN